jgi:hypothetical protein
MAAFSKFNTFSREVLSGTHDFSGGHTFKLMLSSGAPTASDAVKADVAEIAAGGGYPAGGPAVACTLTLSGGVAKVTIADEVITATGAIATFRYGTIYNDTASGKPLVGWFDHGASITLGTGETFTADFDATAGAFTLA